MENVQWLVSLHLQHHTHFPTLNTSMSMNLVFILPFALKVIGNIDLVEMMQGLTILL